MIERPDYVMTNVSDMGRSVAFYRDTLGLKLKFESPGWSEFLTGQTTLALHLSPPGKTRGVGTYEGPSAGTCSIGFSVHDLDSEYERLRGRGARFVMSPSVQAEEGIRLAVCLDPDGLPISFAEPLAQS